MKLILECVIVIFITVVSFNVLQAQISTEGKPISFNYDTEMFRTNAEFSKIMPLLDIEKLILEDEEEIANGRPARFGYSHEVDFNLENSGQGFDLSDGGKLGKLVIYCPNALSINLLYDKFGLPDGAKFFIYSADKRHSIGAFTSTNNKGNKENIRGFATELVYGDKIVLEYYLPKGVAETGVISINNVIHGYRHVTMFNSFDNEKQKKGDSFQGFGDSPDCFVNVNCSPEGDNGQKEKNAVAMIVAGNYYYTGSLMNNTKNDYTPLLLTTTDAVHNPHDSKGNYVLDYTIFYGNYEAPTCDAPVNAPSSKTTSGAVVISNDVVGTNNLYFTGFALLRLEEDPRYKSGVALYYLGGDRSHTILGNNSSGVSIYHPNGDVKKIAVFNSVTSDSNTSVVANKPSYGVAPGQDTPNGRAAVGGWESDGAPLLNSNKRLIGFYPSIVCTYPICLDQKPGMCYHSCYNKLSVAWLNNSTDYQRRLKEGLDPLNLGVITGDGLESVDPCASNKTLSGTLATQTSTGNNITMQNATIPSGAVVKVKACNIISVGPNVIVNTGATLELEAGGSVKIDYSTFKVMAGASFIIK